MVSLLGNQNGIIELNQVIPVQRHGNRVKYVTSISAGLVCELLESEKIQVDYDYQRGVKVTQGKDGSEKRTPMLDMSRVEDMARKILSNELYGGALTWNLRSDEVSAEYDEIGQRLLVTKGAPTIPDSNHRHQAIRKAVLRARELGLSFDEDKYEFPLVIEEMDMIGESGLFYEYNQLGKPANPTRSRFINQASLHNKLASSVMEGSVLDGNVELVTNNLTRNTNKVLTFNTLARGIEEGFRAVDEINFDETRDFLVEFVNTLAKVRPEVAYLPISERLKVREAAIGDSGLIFQAYFRLAGDLQGTPDWENRLGRLGEPYTVLDGEKKDVLYEGDLMSRHNPVWQNTVLVESANGRVSIANRKYSQEYAYRKLREVVGLQS